MAALVIFVAGILTAFAEEKVAAPLTSDWVWQKVLARNKTNLLDQARPRFTYVKLSTSEELDAKDQVKKKQEKLYEVTLVGSETRTRLVKVDGKPVGASAKKEEDSDGSGGKQADGSRKGRSRKNGALITEEILARYDHKLERRDRLDGRGCYVISFNPKSGTLPVNQMADKILNRLAGFVWVDEEDFEVVKLDVHLTEKVSVWGGLVGSMESFDMSLVRSRSREGVWFNNSFDMALEGRRLVESIRMRVREKSSGFRMIN